MSRFWRQCRTVLRCVRFAAWFTVLAVLVAFIWCNRIGLPEFLKARIVGTLSERGVKLEFSRMRLSLIHGLVAENVRAGQAQVSDSPAFTARQVQLQLNFPALLRWGWQLDGLVVRDGQFIVPLSPTNALRLDNLQTDLRFQANDTWSFDDLRANFAGTRIVISGEVTHAPEAAHWKLFAGRTGDKGEVLDALKTFSDTVRKIHFQGEPQLRLALAGDARDPHGITVRLNITATGVSTPWFSAHDFQSEASLTAPATAPTNIALAWGGWTNVQPFRLGWSLSLGELHSVSLDANALHCAGFWAAPTLAVTQLTGQCGGGQLVASAALNVDSRILEFTNDSQIDPHAVVKCLPEGIRAPLAEMTWTQPPALHVTGSLRLPTWTNVAKEWQRDIAPSLSVHGNLAFTNAVAGGLRLNVVRTHFSYTDLLWDVPDLTVEQGRTRLCLSGEVSEATKNVHFLLTGQLDEASVAALMRTSNAVHGLAQFSFQEPLVLSVDVSGNLRTLETLCATGQLALTNFAIRGERMDSITGRFFYTNLTATIFAPQLWRENGAQWIKADTVLLDLRRQAIWITNGWALADPQAVVRAIGPKTAHLLEPYHFLAPPLVRVNGSTPIVSINNAHDAQYADLTFEIMRGVPFHWSKLLTTNVTATIRWFQQSLTLSNIVADLYAGHGEGGGYLDFRPVTHDCDFNFSMAVTNINLHLLAADLSTNVSNLAGQLTGEVVVTNASSEDWHSWNGGGRVQLRDGILWDVPIFAFVSPLLNHVAPGLGNNRASDAAAVFVITNGVIVTDSLRIHTEMMRLQYAGTVDLKQNVNAHVTAQLLRNLPVVGSMVSLVLSPVGKIFECHVTGQLDEPVVTPVFIPKILLAPLHPIRSLEELFIWPVTNNAPDIK